MKKKKASSSGLPLVSKIFHSLLLSFLLFFFQEKDLFFLKVLFVSQFTPFCIQKLFLIYKKREEEGRRKTPRGFKEKKRKKEKRMKREVQKFPRFKWLLQSSFWFFFGSLLSCFWYRKKVCVYLPLTDLLSVIHSKGLGFHSIFYILQFVMITLRTIDRVAVLYFSFKFSFLLNQERLLLLTEVRGRL